MSEVRAAGGGRVKNGLAVGDASITRKPNCPKELLRDGHAIDAWHSNLEIMIERKQFASEDIPLLINYCNAWSHSIAIESELEETGYTEMTATGGSKVHPVVNVKNIYVNQLMKLGAQLGLNPMSRARIIGGGKGNGDGDGNEFDEF
jgi:P27 family predicted phage terminase small subunit